MNIKTAIGSDTMFFFLSDNFVIITVTEKLAPVVTELNTYRVVYFEYPPPPPGPLDYGVKNRCNNVIVCVAQMVVSRVTTQPRLTARAAESQLRYTITL